MQRLPQFGTSMPQGDESIPLTYLLASLHGGNFRIKIQMNLAHLRQQNKHIVIKAILYAFQAGQSLDRAIPNELEELRECYSGEDIEALAASLVQAIGDLRKTEGRSMRFFFTGKSPHEDDLYVTARLLFDFAMVMKGGTYSWVNLGNLRHCLTINSLRLADKYPGFPRLSLGGISYFNRNDNLPKPMEIEEIINELK